jgi:hypothetical protein
MFHTKSVVKNVKWEMIYIEKIISPEAPYPSKFTRTAMLSPRSPNFNKNTYEIMSQPIGPNENCKTIREYKQDTKYTIIYLNFSAAQAIFFTKLNA